MVFSGEIRKLDIGLISVYNKVVALESSMIKINVPARIYKQNRQGRGIYAERIHQVAQTMNKGVAKQIQETYRRIKNGK